MVGQPSPGPNVVSLPVLRRLTPERLALGFAALAAIVLWNAVTYPSGAGYDATSHKEYGDFVIDHLRLPHENETPEYYSPPLYYAITGGLPGSAGRPGSASRTRWRSSGTCRSRSAPSCS